MLTYNSNAYVEPYRTPFENLGIQYQLDPLHLPFPWRLQRVTFQEWIETEPMQRTDINQRRMLAYLGMHILKFIGNKFSFAKIFWCRQNGRESLNKVSNERGDIELTTVLHHILFGSIEAHCSWSLHAIYKWSCNKYKLNFIISMPTFSWKGKNLRQEEKGAQAFRHWDRECKSKTTH